MTSSMYSIMTSTMSSTADGWLCSARASQTTNAPSPAEISRRRKKTREQAAKSKTGVWGPTHSFDSGDEEKKTDLGIIKPRSDGTGSTKSSISPSSMAFARAWNSAHSVLKCGENDTLSEVQPPPRRSLMDYVDDVCSPCHPRNLAKSMDSDIAEQGQEPQLGIGRLEPPTSNTSSGSPPKRSSSNNNNGDQLSTTTEQTPADRRRERHKIRQQRSTPPSLIEETGVEVTPEEPVEEQKASVPVETLELKKEDAMELERSISELTMRSSYGQATAMIAENRRMAYYAVGRHHRQSGRGGNRRCYFTGKLILSGAPFYAGSVQQGLRTLVVFCLPSSIGLPKESPSSSQSVVQSLNESTQNSSRRFSLGLGGNLGRSTLSRKGSRISRLSSVDDMSLSVGEELDPNYGLDREYLLHVLPEPSQGLLDEMAVRYPAQFETLPVQVRSPSCWRLFVKFCFFSGLPIAEGELHYTVREEIADQYGEEVILSHEVMEAVNGESAEILRLPNLKTFKYLHKHYNQQSSKLPKHFFERQSWDLVLPEI
jgi:hypothetical protein